MADRDYLAARACWRLRLPEQFLWSALQTVEKQLKAILLYNGQSAKGLGHDVAHALDLVTAIPDLGFAPPEVIRSFVAYLNRHAPNRYLERPFYLRGEEIFELDRAVWHFRRYCQDLRALAGVAGKSEEEWLALHREWFVDPKHRARPYKFRLFNGYLEKVLEGKQGKEQYEALVWKNVYFGKRDKGTITYQPLSWSAVPPHVRHPDVFKELSAVIQFPKDVRDAFGGH